MGPRQLLLFVDPGFSLVGHYRAIASNLRAEAARRDLPLWHCVGDRVDAATAERLGLRRCFRYPAVFRQHRFFEDGRLKISRPFFAARRAVRDRIELLGEALRQRVDLPALRRLGSDLLDDYNTRALRSFSTRLAGLLREARREADEVTVYMYTCHPRHFAAVAEVLEEVGPARLRVFLNLFYLDTRFCAGEESPDYTAMLRAVSAQLERCDPGRVVRLTSDSERTVARYAPCFERPIGFLPIPLVSKVELPDPAPARPGPLVGFFGCAHVRNGYDLMYRLCRKLTRDPESPVRFLIRHREIPSDGFSQRSKIDRFRALQTRVEHLSHDLGQAEYLAQIARCDVVLIPYRREHYPCQTSGILIDALTQGRLVVAPEHTWMGDIVRSLGVGTTFVSGDLDSLAASLDRICADLPEQRLASRAKVESFCRQHTASGLFTALELARGDSLQELTRG